MEKLQDNWLTEGLLDFEYKKFILLAYLQSVKKNFGQQKLYPTFSDLIFHYKNLLKIQEQKELIKSQFPKEITDIDIDRLKISYKSIIADEKLMKEIEEIVFFALPLLKSTLQTGKEIYELVEENLEILPVGLHALYHDEGYIFLNEFNLKEIQIYRYKTTVFQEANEKYRGIHLHFLKKVRKQLGQTYEQLKIELIKSFRFLPNPATYLVVAKIPCPFEETLFPVSKRVLVKRISEMAA